MSTNHHTPHTYHADLTSAEINRPLGELDAAIETVITTGSGVSTSLTALAGAGQKSLTVATSAGYVVGDPIYIGTGAMFEGRIVDTVPGGGVTITVTVNLTNTYAIGTPVSKSSVEIVDARADYTTLGGRLAAHAAKLAPLNVPTAAMPAGITAFLDGPTIGSTSVNAMGIQLVARLEHDFSTMGGNDPGFVWGMWLWTLTGTDADAGKGISTLYGLECELGFRSSAQDIDYVRGVVSSAGFWPGSGGHIGVLEGVGILNPGFHPGADSGDWTIDSYYGLHITEPTVATYNFAILVDGGRSRFGGDVELGSTLKFLNHYSSALITTIQAGGQTPQGHVSGAAGDFYFRTDTPSTANQRLYVCTGGTNWTGIA